MAFSVTIDADASRLIAAMDQLGSRVEAWTKRAALVTANRVCAEAKARVPRRTGRTMEGIHVEEAYSGLGYVVMPDFTPDVNFSWHTSKRSGRSWTQKVTQNNLPIWLEFGTKYMTARPFLFAAARLEEDAHDRRMREAVQDAIDELGLGE